MARIPGLRRAFRPPWRRGAAVEDEFRFHLEMRAGELVAQGWLPDAARHEALRQFGDLDDARRYCERLDHRRERETMRTEWLQRLRQDLAFAARTLRRTPGFTLVAVLTLALGIGANVTMFGLVDQLLLRPPAAVAAPDEIRRLYFLETEQPGVTDTSASISYPLFRALRDHMTSARGVAVYFATEQPLGEGEGTRRARVMGVSANYFATLGVAPAAGRFFDAAEDRAPQGAAVAVLSHAAWQRDFAGARGAIGQSVTISGRRYEIVGVAARAFGGIEQPAADVWVPITAIGGEVIGRFLPGAAWHEAANVGWLRAIARVPAASETQATAQATAAFRGALERSVGAARTDSMRPSVLVAPVLRERGPERTPAARIALWLAGMALVVLLIACANVANLLLARALRRQREIAVRVALGAGRRRLVSQLLTEGLLLAALGGATALVIAVAGRRFVGALLLPEASWDSTLADPRTLAMAAALALGAGLLAGLAPALQARVTDLVSALKTGGREGGGHRSLTRNALVVSQAALSLVLLAGAGLFVRSLRQAQSVELGFAAEQVTTVDLDFRGTSFDRAAQAALYQRLLERVAALPGVQHAALSVVEPFNTVLQAGVRLPGRDSVTSPDASPLINSVTPGYFAAIGTRIVAGRGIEAGDRRGTTPVTVVSERLAQSFWPGRSPLGECILLADSKDDVCLEVVGIARDVRWNALRGDAQPQMYVAMEQGTWDFPLRILYVRSSGGTAQLAPAIRREVRELAPGILYTDVASLSENLEPELRPWRLGASMFSAFGLLALVLAALGLYGVLAYSVAQRAREMGVRIALGARAMDVVRLVVTQGVRVALVGVGIGLVLALVAGRWIAPLLFETAANDPLILLGVAAILLTVAVAASLIPALRAARVPPAVAMRAD